MVVLNFELGNHYLIYIPIPLLLRSHVFLAQAFLLVDFNLINRFTKQHNDHKCRHNPPSRSLQKSIKTKSKP